MIDFDHHDFARTWIAAWNAGAVETVLERFHEDAVFSSPLARMIGHGDNGTVRGKEAIRSYWMAALEKNPGLRFDLDAVHVGVDTLVIGFTTQDGVRRAEVLIFDGQLVKAGYGTAAVASA